MQFREFHNAARNRKTRVWRIAVDGDQVITEYGERFGQLQRVSDTAKAKNVGRANEMTPEQVAIEMAERETLLKTRNGYIEVNELGQIKDAGWQAALQDGQLFDFDNPPTNLGWYKPDNTLSGALTKKLEARQVWLSRKRDGEAMPIFVGSDGVIRIFSRKMLRHHDKETAGTPWESRFMHLVETLSEMRDRGELPHRSILLGEMTMDRNGDDDRWHTASVMKSLTPRAIQLQQEHGPLSYYIWDIPFWDGQDLVRHDPVRTRYELIHSVFGATPHVLPVDYVEAGALEALADWAEVERGETYNSAMGRMWNIACFLAHQAGWEGWVTVDPDGVYGDKGWNFRGKTDRPGNVCGKLKPEFEDDFIAEWDPENKIGEYGTGKYQGLIGSVVLYQVNSRGERTYICECGNGFSEQFLKGYSDPGNFPLVMKVKYSSRTYTAAGAKTNALQFPAFVEVRTDKTVDECINPRL